MNIIRTHLPGVLVIEPKVFGDSRGFFFECFHAQRYAEQGMKLNFVQDNFSQSSKGVLRGLHYQLEHAQGKLVWVTRGSVLDVAIDIRFGSPTFGKKLSIVLNASQPKQLYIPPGFAHGFYTLEDGTHFHYKCTDYYHPASEKGIRWDDPTLAIEWPATDEPILSNKDSAYPFLHDLKPTDLPSYSGD